MSTHTDFEDYITVGKTTYDQTTHTTEVEWRLKSYDGTMLLMDYTTVQHEEEATPKDRADDIAVFVREKEEELRQP